MHAGRGCCDWLARFLLGGFCFSYVNDVFIFEHGGISLFYQMYYCIFKKFFYYLQFVIVPNVLVFLNVTVC